ncbi:hypothetical protein ACFQZ8_13605, partial [Micromonospora azadirachtae]
QATARTAGGWLRGRELAVLHPDDRYVQTRIAVPGRYVRDVPVEFSDGQRRTYQVVDLAAIVADGPRIRTYANGNLRLETSGRRDPMASTAPTRNDPPAYQERPDRTGQTGPQPTREPVRLTPQRLDEVLDEVVGERTLLDALLLEDCAELVDTFAGTVYREGIRPAEATDDTAVDRGGVAGVRAGLVAGPGWYRAESADALRDVVDRAGVGATALIMASRDQGRTGHVLALHHTVEGVRWADPQRLSDARSHTSSEATPELLGQSIGIHFVLIDSYGQVVTIDHPGLGDVVASGTRPESTSTAAALIDAPTNHEFGYGAPELELHDVEVQDVGQEQGVELLRTADGLVRVKVDGARHYRGSDGRWYLDTQKMPAGVEIVERRGVLIPEIVARPWAMLRGERGQNAARIQRHMEEIRRVLRNAGNVALRDLFRGRDYVVANDARNWKITSWTHRFTTEDTLFQQITAGLPLHTILNALAGMSPHIRNGRPREMVRAGRDFATRVTAMQMGLPGATADDRADGTRADAGANIVRAIAHFDKDVSTTVGVLALAFIQAATIPLWWTISRGEGAIPKAYLTAASRLSLHDLRDKLPAPVKTWLYENRRAVRTAFASTLFAYLDPRPDKPADILGMYLDAEAGLPSDAPPNIGMVTVQRFLDQLLVGRENLSQAHVLDVADAIDVPGRSQKSPLVPVEFRQIGARHTNWEQHKADVETVTRVVRTADETATMLLDLAGDEHGRALVHALRTVVLAAPQAGPA